MSDDSTRASSTSNKDWGEWLAKTVMETAPDGEIVVIPTRLQSVSQRPPIGEYLRRLWQRRYFIVADARAKAFQGTRGTVLGRIWLILQPFLDSLIYWVIFGLLLQVSRGIPNFLGYLVIGVNFFVVVQAGLTSGSGIIQQNQNLIRAFAFPRASLVISWTLRSILNFIPILLATLVFIVAVPYGDPPQHVLPTLLWLLVIPALLLGFLFGFGLALFTSAVTAAIPDMKFIWPLIGRFWFYVSGVFFSIDRFDSVPLVKSVMEANPGYVFLSMCRDLLIYDTLPSLNTWIYMAGWGIGITVIGFTLFWSREESYGQQRA